MPGLLRGVARTAVIAGTATSVSNRVSRRQARRWGYEEAQQQGGYPPPEQAYAAPPPSPDPVERLGELARLRDQGALTDAEFAAAKARLLGT